MEKLTICRICLVENVRMHIVGDSHLREIFEKLTNIPFITEDGRPMLACFFCYARLKQCYKFWQKCLEAEAVFMMILDEEYEQEPIQAELEFFGGFLKTPIEHISIGGQQEDEREDKDDMEGELTGGCEIIDDVEIKAECNSDASEKETKDDRYPDFVDNPDRIVFQSDSKDDIPVSRMKTGVENFKKKRRATQKKREASATVAKKPKLDIRKAKLEDAFPTKDKKNDHANSKVIDRTKSSTFKSVTKIIDLVKSKPITKPIYLCTDLSNNINNDDFKSKYKGINSDDIKKHGLFHSNLSKKETYNCDICESCFTNQSDLEKHIRIHTGEKLYKCDVCQKSIRHKGNLSRHIRIHMGEKPYKCDICQRSFIRKCGLKEHISTHSRKKQYKFDMCQNSFNIESNLKTRTRIHNNEKPYKCDVCQSSFTQKASLKLHIRVHTVGKLYECDICQSRFNQKCNLLTHIRTHTGEKPYKCYVCKSNFTDHANLNKHIRVHTGEKPYKCNICQISFTRKYHLTCHIRIHSGEKPYKCDVCQSSFNHKNSLNLHILNHTGVKPYKCDICQRSYTLKSRLKRHSYTHRL